MAVHDSLCKQIAKLLNYGYTRLVERLYHLILPHTHVADISLDQKLVNFMQMSTQHFILLILPKQVASLRKENHQ